MKIINRKVIELIQAEYNPRVLSPEAYDSLKDSLLRFGIVDPIIININPERKDIVIGGHQRLRVWSDLGKKTIPCVEIDLSLEKEKELNIRLNKNTGDWDWTLLSENFDIDKLLTWGFVEGEIIDADQFSDNFTLPLKDKDGIQTMTFTVAEDQAEFITEMISRAKGDGLEDETFGNENQNGNTLYAIMKQWDRQNK